MVLERRFTSLDQLIAAMKAADSLEIEYEITKTVTVTTKLLDRQATSISWSGDAPPPSAVKTTTYHLKFKGLTEEVK